MNGYETMKNRGNSIYGWAGNAANDIWQKASKAGSTITNYSGQAKIYASDITNKIWQTTKTGTAEAGTVLKAVTIKAYDMATSPKARQLLKESQEIATAVSRILVRIHATNAMNTIKERSKQGVEIGILISPECALIGATLGAAFGLCEFVLSSLEDEQLKKEASNLSTRCQIVSNLVKQSYNADMSPLVTGGPHIVGYDDTANL